MNLNAENLKSVLWDTLQKLQANEIGPGPADAIAAQAREIVRTTNLQIKIAQMQRKQLSESLVKFAEEGADGNAQENVPPSI